jgi:hypothetical protein
VQACSQPNMGIWKGLARRLQMLEGEQLDAQDAGRDAIISKAKPALSGPRMSLVSLLLFHFDIHDIYLFKGCAF